MRSSVITLLSLFLLSCNSVEINCESSNHDSLVNKAKGFIEKNIHSDDKTKNMSLSNYKFVKGGCRANEREKTVSFKVSVLIRESNKDRSTSFRCDYLGKDDDIRCGML